MRISVLLAVIFALSRPLYANVVGADTQNFNPTTSGLDFVTVHSSETLRPGVLNVGLFLNYAVNTLPNYIDVNTGSRTELNDTLFSSDLNFGLGLANNLDFGISMPRVLTQTVDSDVDHGLFEEPGVTEYRANSKYRFFGDQNGGLAAIGTINFHLIQNNPYTGQDPGPTYNLELAYDTTFDDIAFGVNVGYRIRQAGEAIANVPIEPFGNQFIASTAVSYLLPAFDTKLIGEIFGSFPTENQVSGSDRDVSSMELLLGLKTDIRHDIALHVGGGTEIFHGTSSPDWRVYTGINWNFGPLFGQPENPIVRVVEDDVAASPMAVVAVGEDPFGGTPVKGQEENFVARDILFEFDSITLKDGFDRFLMQLAEYLNKGPGFQRLIIAGHSDSVGNAAYNLDLSRRRAKAVLDILAERSGVSRNKMRSVGFGESKPIADNGNYQGRALNRRVEFKILR